MEHLRKIMLDDPDNKWCLECKDIQSTHCIVFFGIFVCEECAGKIVDLFGRFSTWPKKVLQEQWDDAQLLHIEPANGGNRPVLNLFKEFAIENCPMKDRYESKIFQWYRSKHHALAEGRPFDQVKPEKTWSQFFTETKLRAEAKVQRASFKTACLAHRAD